jgi:hypothetical protein
VLPFFLRRAKIGEKLWKIYKKGMGMTNNRIIEQGM